MIDKLKELEDWVFNSSWTLLFFLLPLYVVVVSVILFFLLLMEIKTLFKRSIR
jgi:hypothetical protein